jgi:hypothetical protein
VEAKSDTSLFIYQHGADTAYLLLYVDDIVLTASSEPFLRRIIYRSSAGVCYEGHGCASPIPRGHC